MVLVLVNILECSQALFIYFFQKDLHMQNQVPNALQYKPADAAKLLSMSERKLHDLLQSGEIHSVKIGGSRYIAHETLLNWIKSKHDLFAQAL